MYKCLETTANKCQVCQLIGIFHILTFHSRRAKVLLTTLMTALFYSDVPVSRCDSEHARTTPGP